MILLISTVNIPNKNLEIISFDVQNGDAFLIKTPQNKYLLIDTGKDGYKGASSKAKMIILKYLRDKGINKIDSMILTHFDSDHAGGAVDLIDNLQINKIYVNSLNDKSKIAKKIYSKNLKNIICVDKKIKINEEKDFFIELNKANIMNDKNIDNELSIISLLKYKDFTMLFTGDAGVDAFNNLKNDIPANITILKVGHHGAKGVVDKNMMNYLNPDISLISVGANTYGHPSYSILKLLEKSKIYRTDKDNSIKITVNEKGYKLYTYSSKIMKYIEQLN